MVALYKVGTGEDITKAAAPGMFDLKVSLRLQVASPEPRAGSRSLMSICHNSIGQSQEQGLAEGCRRGHHRRAGPGAIRRPGREAEGDLRLRREQAARGRWKFLELF